MEMFFFLKRIIKFQPCLRLKVKYRCTSEKFKVDTGFILGFIGFYWVIWMFTGQSWRGRRRPRRRRHLDAYGAAKVDLEPFHSVRGRRRPEMNECDNRSDGQRQQRSKKKKHSHTRPIATFEIGFCKKTPSIYRRLPIMCLVLRCTHL